MVAPGELHAGDLVEIQWDPTTTRTAVFQRMTRTGSVVVRVERVGRDGRGTGEYGAPRTFLSSDVLRILERGVSP